MNQSREIMDLHMILGTNPERGKKKAVVAHAARL